MAKRQVVNVKELVNSAVRALQEVAALDAAADVQAVSFERGALLEDIEVRLGLVQDVLDILYDRQGDRVSRLAPRVQTVPFSVFQIRTTHKSKCHAICDGCGKPITEHSDWYPLENEREEWVANLCNSCFEGDGYNLDLELERLRGLLRTK